MSPKCFHDADNWLENHAYYLFSIRTINSTNLTSLTLRGLYTFRGTSIKTVIHLFIECPIISPLWRTLIRKHNCIYSIDDVNQLKDIILFSDLSLAIVTRKELFLTSCFEMYEMYNNRFIYCSNKLSYQ